MAYLELKHVTKRFGDLVANDDVSLTVEKGHIHALLGENGAGKSTLMNILYGLYTPTAGEIWLNGKKLDIRDPKQAIAAGIGMVHQHFMLIPALTVIENVMLGYKEISHFRLNLNQAAQRFTALAEKFNMPISPWEKVENLTIGQQQRLEILKALFRNSKLLILDEPTAVLTPQETDTLFTLLHQLTDEGLTIIFITHKLGEVMDICDQCTVLRQGRVAAANLPISEIHSHEQLAELMVGKSIDLVTHKAPAHPGDTVLEVRDLHYTDREKVSRLNGLSFQVRAGEIVGVAGVDGNGQSELVRCILGLLQPESGAVYVENADVTGKHPKEILAHGVAHIPEDRYKMAMIKEMSVNENLILMSYDKEPYATHGVLHWKEITRRNEELCKKYEVKTPSVAEQAGRLSGGNQQKFVVGRELDRAAKLIIAVYPDRGLDIGTTKYIQSRLVEERDRGAAVLLLSTELDEILELSDTIMVLYKGRIMAQIPQKEAQRETIGLLMAGVQVSGSAAVTEGGTVC
ncbi:nucleoside ABC transporter ATP-binding protein [Oscillibacter sp. PC13]|uniref:ABC transporter ATP-binding protein n=1 Tax=Oscillibacter sp. PC13 TaxID=1855299 RepID=UPI0008E5DAEF|nr:ABC transporter ATP-binding protein [Oscillibacter sp. PC13]SFQ03208.1 nucleoside ABC transporter ATP-binding protein [Oscillibacter sp. PC13]